MRAALALTLALLSLGAAAEEPPAPRPERADSAVVAAPDASHAAPAAPPERPESAEAPASAAPAPSPALPAARPERPASVAAVAVRAAPPTARSARRARPASETTRPIPPAVAQTFETVALRERNDGALCGDRRLRGARAASIDGPGGCGVQNPVRLEGVGAVRLEPAVTVDCAVGRALADWIEEVVQPAAQVEEGVPVTMLRTYAGYVCRPRNNQRNAKLSLHGKGLAIDIAAFRFADGRVISVLEDWRRADGSAFLRRVWRGACGPFGTVLGPDADRFHVGHLHFDVADYTHGRVCR